MRIDFKELGNLQTYFLLIGILLDSFRNHLNRSIKINLYEGFTIKDEIVNRKLRDERCIKQDYFKGVSEYLEKSGYKPGKNKSKDGKIVKLWRKL